MDVEFLKTFYLCLESWDYTTHEMLSSIITPLEMIWQKGYEGLSLIKCVDQEFPIWPADVSIHDFRLRINELEAKIQQSKQQVEGWCEKLMRSSLMQCKSSTIIKIRDFLQHLWKNLNDFSRYKSAKKIQLKIQIDLLKDKIVFLEESLDIIECCPDREEIPRFLDFIRDFANNATCLTFLYWAKEANEEISGFNMLQKFIPYVYDITPLYISIRKSYDLQPHVSFLLGEAIGSLVDFFFEHLATILTHDFLILRDRLIFLFTFLTDPPRENGEMEDLIRSQIYALLHEDAYLFLPFDETKEMFLDFMIKIDTTTANIRQLYCGFSESWIRTEVEKMEYIYFDSVHREISLIEKQADWADWRLDQLHLYKTELKFLRVFLLCFKSWDDTNEEIRVKLTAMITSLQNIWGKEEEEKGLLAHRFHTICRGRIQEWLPLRSELEGKIQLSKLEIEAWLVNPSDWSFPCKPSTSHKIGKFLDSILYSLNDLVSYKAHKIVPFKKQIATLEDRLVLLTNFLKLTANCIDTIELKEFNLLVQGFANDVACLTFSYWEKDINDKTVSETNSMFSRMLQKIKPTTSDVARLYFGTLKAIYVQRSDSLIFGHAASSFVDFLFSDLMTPLEDEFQLLRDDIIFLLSFLNDPLDKNAGELIYNQIDVLFWEDLYDLLPFDDIEGDFTIKKELLSEFITKIESVNGSIRQMYGKFPDPSLYNFPKVISPGLLDFLLQNLRNLMERMSSDQKYVPFARYKIIKIEEELVSLCPIFNHIFSLESEMNEAWLEVVNLVHLTEHVINSSISSWFVIDRSIWYHMAYLSDVFNTIKVVKTKLGKIQENTVLNASRLSYSSGLISIPSFEAKPSQISEIVIGFEDEAEKIIGSLTRGRMSLDIVSIVGMGGLGKTTLAKKVYCSSFVKCNFNVFAFCSVSQDHDTRRLVIDILCDINGNDDELSTMTDNDLKHKLWKCLSYQKYLIVLDDIWNVSAWNEVKGSFPDNENGSRVMFTTRDCEIAEMCKISCCPYQLRFLSEVESWDLFQKKVFHNGIAPPYLYEIGKVIAKSCKRLPLAIIVIAGLLARTEKNLKWWSEVAEKVVSYLSYEGCMQILELSYIHLPEKLKPCLIYLGAFPEDMLIGVKQVTLLWIAEGFVQESKAKSIEDVAKDYFNDLVARSFIIVSERSSNGEIKTFRVHDLIHEICLTKCRDFNFFLLDREIASSSFSNPSINNYYRVSMQNQSGVTIDVGPTISNARSLLFFRVSFNDGLNESIFMEFRLAQVLNFYATFGEFDMKKLSSLVHLRHMTIELHSKKSISIPSSISNIWNIGSLILTSYLPSQRIHLPQTLWRMRSLRHVKVDRCILKFFDDHEYESCLKLDKAVSFSTPVLSTGKDVQQLMQRLPVVRVLGCILEDAFFYGESVETLYFNSKLESLKLALISDRSEKCPYLINFPSTLKKLTLKKFHLPWTAISAIAELHWLQVLKLRSISLPEQRLEMEDLTFQSLKFFELHDDDLVEWNASFESLPCLEQLVIKCRKLKELPPCFGENPTLKRIVVNESLEVESSALRIREELMELGSEIEVSIYNSSNRH